MDHRLPPALAIRCRWVVTARETLRPPGEFVLYWMHNAIRGHENPALDVAICLARQNGLQLLIYHGLSENYPFASDRHHAFILQAARDVQREFSKIGLTYAFHLERPGHRGPHLRDLTRRAAVLVTEEMPVQPLAGWLDRLASVTPTPIVAVDASCLVTPQELPTVPERFYEYRRLTQALHRDRMDRSYPGLPPDPVESPSELRFEGHLGFEPVNLQDVCLAGLIRSCKIDHTVGPVAESPGGTRAGYARWQHFLAGGLAEYQRARRDPARRHSGSRLSAYLHYGMVSPFRIAREAAAAGARKFLDELLVWREMAFHYCLAHVDDLESTDGLPTWARRTLTCHARDTREVQPWESLARGRTPSPLWNLAQRNLLRHGELHHRLRMTWGKAFLPMTACPEQALTQCIDLNHRYALDGRSPNSYGGILWCFGQFDRPMQSESPVFGNVRSRSTRSLENQLDVDTLNERAARPIAQRSPRVAIVGAGVAGLMTARTLIDHGIDVTVLEKARGVGGRLATRRVRQGATSTNGTDPAVQRADPSLQFDHGAQYFTVRDDRFARYVRSWWQSGLVQPWEGRLVELGPGGTVVSEKRPRTRYVGVPGNQAIAKHLAEEVPVVLQQKVNQLHRSDTGWSLTTEAGRTWAPFDVVILNAPPEQVCELITASEQAAAGKWRASESLMTRVGAVEMSPCWSVLLQIAGLEDLPFEGAFLNEGPLSWIARDDSKPGRPEPPVGFSNWVLHASPAWSGEHLGCSAEEVTARLVDGFGEAIGRDLRASKVNYRTAHRWRFANAAQPIEDECLWDGSLGLGVCGDWCCGARVEGAFLSGAAMAGEVLRATTIDRAAVSGWNAVR